MAEVDPGTVVAEIPKNAREVLRVTSREFNGYDLIDVRTWYYATHDELRPTNKGVTFRKELLPDVLEALGTAAETLGVERRAA